MLAFMNRIEKVSENERKNCSWVWERSHASPSERGALLLVSSIIALSTRNSVIGCLVVFEDFFILKVLEFFVPLFSGVVSLIFDWFSDFFIQLFRMFSEGTDNIIVWVFVPDFVTIVYGGGFLDLRRIC